MKKSCLTAVCMLTCVLCIWVSARAQSVDAAIVSVPFEFVSGGATLPAGEYTISRLNPGVTQELFISGYNKGGTFLLPLAFDNKLSGEPALSFEHVGGKYFLSKIKTLDGVYTLPASRELIMVGKANPPSPTTASASGAQ